MFNVKIQ